MQVIEFNRLRAKTNRANVVVGTVYTPTLLATDGNGTQTIIPTSAPLTETVVGEPRVDLTKAAANSNPGVATNIDFGSGPEPAISHTFTLQLAKSGAIGTVPFNWQAPLRVTDAYAITQDGAPASPTYKLELLGTNNAAVTATLENIAPGSFDVVFNGNVNVANTIWAQVRLSIPKSVVPNTSDPAAPKPFQIVNTVRKPASATWQTDTGIEMTDSNPNNNSVTRTYSYADAIDATRGADWTHVIVDANALATVRTDSTFNPGASYRDRASFRPGVRRPVGQTEWQATPATNVNLFSFWNPADAVIDNKPTAYRGSYGVAAAVELTEDVDYRVYYTTDRLAGTDPYAATWVERSAFTGDIKSVAGVRYEYIGNGGVWAPAPNANHDLQRFYMYPKFTVVRDFPNRAINPTDRGRIDHTDFARSATYSPALHTAGVWVRPGGAAITKSGVALTEAGTVQQPPTTIVNAGQKVRYTLTPRLTGVNVPGGDTSTITIANVRVTDLLPANVLPSTLDFSRVDRTKWSWTIGIDAATSRTRITFIYLPVAKYADPLAPIEFDVRTSQIAPANGQFTNTGTVGADTVFGGNGLDYSVNQTMTANQLNVAQYEKSTDAPIIEVGEPAQYKVTWFNFLSQSQGRTVFVDVLPYNGDGRGTSVTGPITLASAGLSAAAATNTVMQITTDPAVRTATGRLAPADGVTWINYASATPAEIAGATAIRAVIGSFVPGASSVGAINYTLNIPGSRDGDKLGNTANGQLNGGDANPTALGEAAPVIVDVIGASLTGTVWTDGNRNATQDAGEAGIGAVKVELVNSANNQVVATTTTSATGAYSFTNLLGAKYLVRVVASSLPTTPGAWTNTYTFAPGTNGVSGPIDLDAGETQALVDFGYFDQRPAITIDKTGTAPSAIRPGENVTWNFAIENTGNTVLTNVVLDDTLAGLSTVTYDTWPSGTAGTLNPGDVVTARATSPLTQALINAESVTNPVTVNADGPGTLKATASDSATVPLAGTSTITLDKTYSIAGRASDADAVEGDVVTYTFLIENTGTRTLTDVQLADPLAGLSTPQFKAWPDPAAPFVLEPGQSVEATATLTLTQAHINAGSLANTATASGQPPAGTRISASDSVDITFDRTPAIQLDKVAVSDPDAVAGSTVEYTFTIQNTGKSTLTDVSVSDPLPGLSQITYGAWPDPAAPNVLLPNQSVEATATLTLTQKHIDAGRLSNTATAIGTPPVGPELTSQDTANVVFANAPSIHLDKVGVLEQGPVKVGSIVTYTFTVLNDGLSTLSDVEITDPLPGLSAITYGAWPDAAAPNVLLPNESVTATATVALTQELIDAGIVSNTATATGLSPDQVKVEGADTVDVAILGSPSITLVKSAKLATDGKSIVYTFEGVNTGNVTLHDVAISDKLAGLGALKLEWPGADGELAPGDTVTATATLVLTDAHAGTTVKNTATITGTAPDGSDVTATDSASVKVPKKIGLPNTGAEPAIGVAIGGLLLLMAGLALVVVRRARRA